jgi:hypothetical protein
MLVISGKGKDSAKGATVLRDIVFGRKGVGPPSVVVAARLKPLSRVDHSIGHVRSIVIVVQIRLATVCANSLYKDVDLGRSRGA